MTDTAFPQVRNLLADAMERLGQCDGLLSGENSAGTDAPEILRQMTGAIACLQVALNLQFQEAVHARTGTVGASRVTAPLMEELPSHVRGAITHHCVAGQNPITRALARS